MTIKWEYRTDTLTSVMGRDKLRRADLDRFLAKAGSEGWELVHFYPSNVDMKDERDGKLLIFKRPAAAA